MPSKAAKVPQQQNYIECGLFLLTYIDFWTYSPPTYLAFSKDGSWTGDAAVEWCNIGRNWTASMHALDVIDVDVCASSVLLLGSIISS